MSGRRRPYYAPYTDHMLNFYVRYKSYSETSKEIHAGNFRSSVDRVNWAACQQLDDQLTPYEREIITAFHGSKNDNASIQEQIAAVAYRHGVDVQTVWDTEHSIQQRLAVIRGLIADGAR